jgi:hypothetical protein
MASLAIQLRWTTHFCFYVVSLLGKTESPTPETADAPLLLRLFTPVLKATLAKTGVAFLSECMECLGGQGYVEEGGIAVHYRDLQVNAIWEGTTNVLAEDLLRVLRGKTGSATFDALDRYISRAVGLGRKCEKLRDFVGRVEGVYTRWRKRFTETSEGVVSAHARELMLTLGKIVGAMEMLIDAIFDGDDVEVECCKRIFDTEERTWSVDDKITADWDRRIVFGDTLPMQPKL